MAEAPFRTLEGCLRAIADVQANAARRTPVPDDATPTYSVLRELVRTMMAASLMPDEGRFSRFTVAFAGPQEGTFQLAPRPLSAAALASLAPVATGSSRIGVHQNATRELEVWGLVPARTRFLELRCVAPCHIVAALAGWNLAVFKRDEWISLERWDTTHKLPHGVGREHIADLLSRPFESTQSKDRRAITGTLLMMVLIELRRQGHGGTILILPQERTHRDGAEAWLDWGPNRLDPPVGPEPVFATYLPRLVGQPDPIGALLDHPGIRGYLGFHYDPVDPMLMKSTRPIGQLCATDGAVVLSEGLEILGFGAVIRQPVALGSVAEEISTRSLLSTDHTPSVIKPIRELGGTRRRSAATLVANAYDAVALVSSHDGPVTLGMWGTDGNDPSKPARPIWISDLDIVLD